jgi:hypothetical protein
MLVWSSQSHVDDVRVASLFGMLASWGARGEEARR